MAFTPFAPGTTTRQDKFGRVTGVKSNVRGSEWTNIEIDILEEIGLSSYQPVDVVAPLLVADVLANPPSITMLASIPHSGIVTTSLILPKPKTQSACEIIKYVPYLGPFLAGSCTVSGAVVAGVGIYSWLKGFAAAKYAVYFRGQLLTVLTAGAAEVFMVHAKRRIRDQVRLRKGG